MQRNHTCPAVLSIALALFAAVTCHAESRPLNDAQLRAAPGDNPGVKTVGGYIKEVAIKDSDGRPVTGETKKAMMELYDDHGVRECTVWMDAEGVGTWQAPAAINEDGSFPEDTVITGMNRNAGRTETRKKGVPPASRPAGDASSKDTNRKAAGLPKAGNAGSGFPITIAWNTPPSGNGTLSAAPAILYEKGDGQDLEQVEVVLEYMVKQASGYGKAAKAANGKTTPVPGRSGLIATEKWAESLLLSFRLFGVKGDGKVRVALYRVRTGKALPTEQVSNPLEIVIAAEK